MARVPPVTRDAIDAAERAAYDAFVEDRRQRLNSGPGGPYALLAHMPLLAQRVESLRVYLREENSLSQKLQELVMITVAREMDCVYIWYAHAAAARAVGIAGVVIDAIRERREPVPLDPEEQTAVDFTRELLRKRKVGQTTFDRAEASFGRRGTLTLTNLISCYALLAYNMNAFELEAPVHAIEPSLPL